MVYLQPKTILAIPKTRYWAVKKRYYKCVS